MTDDPIKAEAERLAQETWERVLSSNDVVASLTKLRIDIAAALRTAEGRALREAADWLDAEFPREWLFDEASDGLRALADAKEGKCRPSE